MSIVNVEQKDMARALRTVAPAVAGNAKQLPVMSGVRLGPATVSATNGDLSISTVLVCDLEAIVPFTVFNGFISQLEGTISLDLQDNDLLVKGGAASIKLRCYPGDDWPQWPALKEPKAIDGANVFESMRRVAYAASKDQARPILTSVCVGGGWVVATDSYRLAALPIEGEASGLIPATALKVFDRLVGAPTIHVDDRRVQLATDDATVSARLIEGQFPSWQRLIPESMPTHVEVDREALMAAVGRAATLRNSEQPVILESSAEGIVVRLTAQDVGSFSEVVEAKTPEFGKVAFSPVFLLDALNAVSTPTVTIELDGASKPAIIRDGDMVNLLMPVRVA